MSMTCIFCTAWIRRTSSPAAAHDALRLDSICPWKGAVTRVQARNLHDERLATRGPEKSLLASRHSGYSLLALVSASILFFHRRGRVSLWRAVGSSLFRQCTSFCGSTQSWRDDETSSREVRNGDTITFTDCIPLFHTFTLPAMLKVNVVCFPFDCFEYCFSSSSPLQRHVRDMQDTLPRINTSSIFSFLKSVQLWSDQLNTNMRSNDSAHYNWRQSKPCLCPCWETLLTRIFWSYVDVQTCWTRSAICSGVSLKHAPSFVAAAVDTNRSCPWIGRLRKCAY